MSKDNPTAPEGFVWLFLDIDVSVCRDFILLEEQKRSRKMTNEEAESFIAYEFSFGAARAKQIVDTIKGEIV